MKIGLRRKEQLEPIERPADLLRIHGCGAHRGQTNLAHFGSGCLILPGLFAILVMLLAPKGRWGCLSDRFGFELFPIRRRRAEQARSEL